MLAQSARMYMFLIAQLVVFSALTARAQTTWYVNDDACPGPGSGTALDPFCSIQDALAAAADGDEISVSAGTYYEAIDLLGKAVTLHSTDGAAATTIDATGLSASAIVCMNQEGPNTVIDGFTVTGGAGTDDLGTQLGGGLFVFKCDPSVIACTFTDNAADLGGAAMLIDSQSTFTDCTFDYSTARHSGGGVFLDRGSPTFDNCVVRDCDATGDGHGGGICAVDATLNFTGGGIAWNDVYDGSNGGGAYLSNCASKFSGVTIAGNRAGGSGIPSGAGGGVYVVNGQATFVDADIALNTARGGQTAGGAGLYATGATIVLTDSTLRQNHTHSGGGAGAYLHDCRLTMSGGGVTVNIADDYDNYGHSIGGGGILIDQGTGSVTEVVFVQNAAQLCDDGGGAIHVTNGDHVFTRCTFSENVARYSPGLNGLPVGGAIYAIGFAGQFEDCGFSFNVTEDGNGGAVYLSSANPTFSGCSFDENTAGALGDDGHGGALYATGTGSISVIRSRFAVNMARRWGGAIHVAGGAHITLVNTLVHSNDAFLGTGLYLLSSTAEATNCTIASQLGTVVRSNGAAAGATISNSILWNPSGIEVGDVGGAVSTVNYSDLSTPWGGAGGNNITADPQFLAKPTGDYYPVSWSPCIDVGSNVLLPPTAATDLDGRARVLNGTVDMGAYEWLPGDFTLNDNVNLADWGTLVEAMNGPGVALTPGTNTGVDLDHDGDCDMADAAILAAHFTGP